MTIHTKLVEKYTTKSWHDIIMYVYEKRKNLQKISLQYLQVKILDLVCSYCQIQGGMHKQGWGKWGCASCSTRS